MRAAPTEDATRVSYQWSNERRRASELIQVWKSEVTGREFEVRESRSYASSDELTQGAEGYLDFTAGAPAVTRRPLERSERIGRYRRRLSGRRDVQPSRASRPGNITRWLLVGALLLVILWSLL